MKWSAKISVVVFFAFIKVNAFGQCAMCKAVVESDFQSGGTAAQGVNDGIIYLMIAPYILLGGVGYFIYRHYKRTNLTQEV